MYPVEALVGALKNFSCAQNIVDRPYSYLFALKPFKFIIYGDEIFENSVLPYEDLQFLACFSLPTSLIAPPMAMSNA
jgi:hypothetical protein